MKRAPGFAIVAALLACAEPAPVAAPQPASEAPAPVSKAPPPPPNPAVGSLPISPHLRAVPQVERVANGLLAAAQRRPNDRLAARELADFLLEQNEHAAARAMLRWLLATADPSEPSADLWLDLSVVEMHVGRLDRAREAAQRVLDADPASAEAHFAAGVVAFHRQDFGLAERHFGEAVRLDPQGGPPLHDLGVTYLRTGRPAAALPYLERAFQLMPEHLCLQFDLMNAYRQLKRPQEAAEMAEGYRRARLPWMNAQPFRQSGMHPAPAALAGGLRFVDVAPALGVDNEGRGRAAAFVDYDGDGDPDILAGHLGEISRLYRNDGGGRFTDVTAEVGLDVFDNGYGHVFADYDNDGDLDLYVSRAGFQTGRAGRDSDLLFRNDGGKFTDVTEEAGLGDPGMAFGSVWGDFDNDGLVDLYVANYQQANRLYHNKGGGRFEDVTAAAGVGDTGYGTSTVAADFDGDGDLDLYVGNNGSPNVLYENLGGMRFRDVTAGSGTGIIAGFATWAADFDNDGDMDLYVTGMNNWWGGTKMDPGDRNALLLNEGGFHFREVAAAAGVDYLGGPMGLAVADLDSDGWLDIYLGNGGPEPLRFEPDVLYRGLGPRGGVPVFADITKVAGIVNPSMGHGTAAADYDLDGDLDLYVSNGAHVDSDRTPNLLWQNQGHKNHWLVVRLVGTKSNRAAIGARATLYARDLVHVEEVSGGQGFGSQGSLELEFGLGKRTSVQRLEIRWPSGLRQIVEAPPVDRFLRVTEGVAGYQVTGAAKKP